MTIIATTILSDNMIANVVGIIIAVIGSSALTAFVNWFFNRRKGSVDVEKVKVETEKIITDMYVELLEKLREEMKTMDDAHENERRRWEKNLERWHERETFFMLQAQELIREKQDLSARYERLEKKYYELKSRVEQTEKSKK